MGVLFYLNHLWGTGWRCVNMKNIKKTPETPIDQAFRGFLVAEGRFELSTPRVLF